MLINPPFFFGGGVWKNPVVFPANLPTRKPGAVRGTAPSRLGWGLETSSDEWSGTVAGTLQHLTTAARLRWMTGGWFFEIRRSPVEMVKVSIDPRWFIEIPNKHLLDVFGKLWKYWDELPTSTGAGFLPSTVWPRLKVVCSVNKCVCDFFVLCV